MSSQRGSPRLIWFFGPSAAGKKTLVRRVGADVHDPLRQHLAIAGKAEICAESLDKDVARSRLVDVISRWPLAPGGALLVKGQSADIWDWEPPLHIPEQLTTVLPACAQEVVFVWARPTELARRCHERASRAAARGDAKASAFWWTYSREGCAQEYTLNRGWVEQLGLPVKWVRNEGDYVGINEAPPARLV